MPCCRVNIQEVSLKHDIDELQEQFQSFLDGLCHQKTELCGSIETIKDSLPNNRMGQELIPSLRFCIEVLEALTVTIQDIFSSTFEKRFRLIRKSIKSQLFQDIPKSVQFLKNTLYQMEVQELVGQYINEIEEETRRMRIRLRVKDKYRTCLNFVPLLEFGIRCLKGTTEKGLGKLIDECMQYDACFQYSYSEWLENKS